MKKSIQIVALFLIGFLLFSGSYKSWIRLSYEINKLEIIEKFCINKEETSFECDGKCHLKTTLDKVDKNSEGANKAENIPHIQLLLFQVNFSSLKLHQHTASRIIYSTFLNHYQYLFSSHLFHPPPIA